MFRILTTAVLCVAAGVAGARAQSGGVPAEAIAAFVAEEMEELDAAARARMSECLGTALADLTPAESAALLAEADFERGLGIVIRGRPEIEDRIEACEE